MEDVVMEKFKNGLRVMAGVVKTGAQVAADGAKSAYAAVEDEESRQQTSETVAVKATEVAETAKEVGSKVGMTFYEGGLSAKQKFDDAGGAEVAKQTAVAVKDGAIMAGEKALVGAMIVGEALNEKIEANETLSEFKRQGSVKIGQAASFLTGLLSGCMEGQDAVEMDPDNPYAN